MIIGVPPSDRGQLDAHVESVKPCTRLTWCTYELGHDGPCKLINRPPQPLTYRGPARVRRKP